LFCFCTFPLLLFIFFFPFSFFFPPGWTGRQWLEAPGFSFFVCNIPDSSPFFLLSFSLFFFFPPRGSKGANSRSCHCIVLPSFLPFSPPPFPFRLRSTGRLKLDSHRAAYRNVFPFSFSPPCSLPSFPFFFFWEPKPLYTKKKPAVLFFPPLPPPFPFLFLFSEIGFYSVGGCNGLCSVNGSFAFTSFLFFSPSLPLQIEPLFVTRLCRLGVC